MRTVLVSIGLVATLILGVLLTGCTGDLVGGAFLRDQSDKVYDVAHVEFLMVAVNPYLQVNEDHILTFDIRGAKDASLSSEAIQFAEKVVGWNNEADASKSKSASSRLLPEAFKYKEWIYPRSGDPGYGYILYIRATWDGLILLLDWNGLKKGLSVSGARQLANWTAQLYKQIPQKKYSSISHLVGPMTSEIHYHCIAYFWPWTGGRPNPVNIRFSDYWSGAGWWFWWID